MCIDTWLKIRCECGKANWICAGDMSDQTVSDVEGCRCWNCDKVSIFDADELYDDEGECRYVEMGMRTPNLK